MVTINKTFEILKVEGTTIKIRCLGTKDDGERCGRIISIGSPGFDIFGRPRTIIAQCPRCKSFHSITTKIIERVVVVLLDKDGKGE